MLKSPVYNLLKDLAGTDGFMRLHEVKPKQFHIGFELGFISSEDNRFTKCIN